MRLDLATRTLFAEFQELVFARSALARETKSTPTYARKRVKGSVYWYHQRFEEGQYKQQYFGPSNKKNDAHVEAARKQARALKKELKQLAAREQRLASMLRKGGVPALDKRIATVLATLSEAGIADGGGILVGTLAYTAYAGMLGVILEKATLATNDIDIVRDTSVEIAVAPAIDIKQLVSKPERTFRAIPGLNPKSLSSSLVSPEGIRIDLLMPQKGRPTGTRHVSGIKGMGALPLPFLDFVIESPVRTIVLGPSGGIPVSVPDPARFVAQKLIVAARRPVSESAKQRKDLEQATQLIRVLSEERPAELKAALKQAKRRGKKWASYLKKSVSRLPEDAQQLIVT